MADTVDDTTKTQTNATQNVSDAPPVTSNKSSIETQGQDSSVPVAKPTMELLQTPEGKALAAKLRKEEKDKLYDRMQKMEKDRMGLEEEKKQLIARQEELQGKLANIEQERSASSKDVETQLADMRKQLELADSRVNVVMEEAAKLVRQSELKAYREKRLVEEGILLKDLVPVADTPEDIDKAIEAAKEQQKVIEDQTRAKLRAELGQNVPSPLAPEVQDQSPIESAAADPARRRDLVKVSRDEYKKIREELLKKAEQATGWKRGHPRS